MKNFVVLAVLLVLSLPTFVFAMPPATPDPVTALKVETQNHLTTVLATSDTIKERSKREDVKQRLTMLNDDLGGATDEAAITLIANEVATLNDEILATLRADAEILAKAIRAGGILLDPLNPCLLAKGHEPPPGAPRGTLGTTYEPERLPGVPSPLVACLDPKDQLVTLVVNEDQSMYMEVIFNGNRVYFQVGGPGGRWMWCIPARNDREFGGNTEALFERRNPRTGQPVDGGWVFRFYTRSGMYPPQTAQPYTPVRPGNCRPIRVGSRG